ncbi:putrescine ABC transporter permease [Salipiger pallidus]|uniref:Putrescine ABC transporter permease n=1 Tax=Salipiger pallidus TaxID=1775170 RepID=A0A8J2ZIG2_9RHOB|nr:ABC transporter permease [Salipiger pallidus]GGG68611.1 putrescine ABC transporter permease [Salipiger pallidus]
MSPLFQGWLKLSESQRFLVVTAPVVLFLALFFLVPLGSILVVSFWRTESYQLITDWNLQNYIDVLTEPSYRTFMLRSVLTALIVSLSCVALAWPIAYFVIRHGGRYKLLLVVGLAVPFLTGIVLRVIALQGVLGPIGLLNMGLMHLGLPPFEALMYTKTATVVGLVYLYLPFVTTAIYLSLLNFNFRLLDAAKVFGAGNMRAFWEITWPLNWVGTVIGFALTFVPSLAASITPRFLGGADGTLFGMAMGSQFSATGTWSLGAAMGVVLFFVAGLTLFTISRLIDLKRSGFTGAGGRD